MAIFNTVYGGEKHWEPNANTLLYLPLENDIVDKSGQATTRVFSSSGISYTTVGGVPSIHIGTTGGILLTTPKPMVTTSTTEQTVSALIYVTSQTSSSRRNICEFQIQNNVGFVIRITENQSYYTTDNLNTPSGSVIANQRNHIVLTNSSSGKCLYLNGALSASGTGSSTPRGSRPYSYEQNQSIFNGRDGLSSNQGLNGNARELIMEDKVWTADDVSKYYTYIKGKLGL